MNVSNLRDVENNNYVFTADVEERHIEKTLTKLIQNSDSGFEGGSDGYSKPAKGQT